MATTDIDVAKTIGSLPIGVQGEKIAQVFRFDLTSWFEEYGSGGSASIDIKRPGDETSYTVPLTIEDNFAVWEVDDIDNAKAGTGQAQLVYTTSGDAKRTKTEQFAVSILPALDEMSGGTPDPYASYLEAARALYGDMQKEESKAAEHRQAAYNSQVSAAASADEAEAAADRAESVFSIAGNVAFAINPDRSVTVTFTEE